MKFKLLSVFYTLHRHDGASSEEMLGLGRSACLTLTNRTMWTRTHTHTPVHNYIYIYSHVHIDIDFIRLAETGTRSCEHPDFSSQLA